MYDYEHKIIGLFIGYYRKQRSISDELFIRKTFIQFKSEEVKELCDTCNKDCAKREYICANKTSTSIEKGIPAKNICFYIDFASKLGKKYQINQKLLKLVEYSENRLVNIMRENAKDDYQGYRTFLLNTIEQYKNYIYFSEMFNLHLIIYDLIMYLKFPSKQIIDFYEEFYKEFKPSTKRLVAFLFYRYYQVYCEDKTKDEYYFQELYKLDKYNLEYQITHKKKTMSSIEFYHYLTHINKQDLTVQKLVLIQYFLVDCLISLQQYNVARNEVNRWIRLIKNNEEHIARYSIYLAYEKKAVILYYLNKYEEAITLFVNVYNYMIDLLHLDFILFIECFRNANRIEEISLYLSNEHFNRINIQKLKRIYRYYQQRYLLKYSLKELELFVLDELYYLIPLNTHYYDLIRRDMMEYCVETKDYKSFFLYQKPLTIKKRKTSKK